MKLRDRFAIAAMQGILANQDSTELNENSIAYTAYSQADSMMRVRAKQDFSGDPDANNGTFTVTQFIPPEIQPAPPDVPITGYQPRRTPPRKP